MLWFFPERCLGGSGHDWEGFSQQAKTRVAVAHMFLPVHAHMCSTGASCSLMGPRWLIYPILSMDSAKCRIGPFRTVIFLTPKNCRNLPLPPFFDSLSLDNFGYKPPSYIKSLPFLSPYEAHDLLSKENNNHNT